MDYLLGKSDKDLLEFLDGTLEVFEQKAFGGGDATYTRSNNNRMMEDQRKQLDVFLNKQTQPTTNNRPPEIKNEILVRNVQGKESGSPFTSHSARQKQNNLPVNPTELEVFGFLLDNSLDTGSRVDRIVNTAKHIGNREVIEKPKDTTPGVQESVSQPTTQRASKRSEGSSIQPLKYNPQGGNTGGMLQKSERCLVSRAMMRRALVEEGLRDLQSSVVNGVRVFDRGCSTPGLSADGGRRDSEERGPHRSRSAGAGDHKYQDTLTPDYRQHQQQMFDPLGLTSGRRAMEDMLLVPYSQRQQRTAGNSCAMTTTLITSSNAISLSHKAVMGGGTSPYSVRQSPGRRQNELKSPRWQSNIGGGSNTPTRAGRMEESPGGSKKASDLLKKIKHIKSGMRPSVSPAGPRSSTGGGRTGSSERSRVKGSEFITTVFRAPTPREGYVERHKYFAHTHITFDAPRLQTEERVRRRKANNVN